MALGDPYVSLAEMKEYLSIPIADVEDDTRVTNAINGASRNIEAICNRQFNDAGSATAREFRASSRKRAVVHDFSTTTGLVVAVGSKSNGYGTTWTISTDFWVEPLNAERHERSESVYWRLRCTSGQFFPFMHIREPNVSVTAQWGWSSVPDAIVEACYIEAARIFRRRDSPEGIIQGFEGNPMRVGWKLDPDVERLTKPYCKHVTGLF